MQTKLKVGDKVLHVSGANCDGYDGMNGEIIKEDTAFRSQPCLLVDFGDSEHIWCYTDRQYNITLDLRLLNPLDGENV